MIGLLQGAECLSKYLGLGEALQGIGQELKTMRVSVVDEEPIEELLPSNIRVRRQ